MFDYLTLVLKDIRRRKFSSFLTLIAISLGILSIYVIITISSGFEQSIQKQFEQLGSNRVIIGSKTEIGFSPSLIKELENKPYIEKVDPYAQKGISMHYGNDYKLIDVFAYKLSEQSMKDFNIKIDVGRYPRDIEKYAVVIGPELAKNGFPKEIKVGSRIYYGDTKFQVVGIYTSLGNPNDDSQVYMNYDTYKEIKDIHVDQNLFVTIKTTEDVSVSADNIKTLLNNRVGKDTFMILTVEELLGQIKSILSIIQYTLGGIAFVSLLVGAFGIINTMYVIITEKTKDIGIMKSVGATNEQILFMYTFQAGVFGVLGAIVGVTQGIIASFGFEKFAQTAGYSFLTLTINPLVVLSLLFFGFFIGIISGYLPARTASKLDVVECLRK